jgi:hypothetical protein
MRRHDGVPDTDKDVDLSDMLDDPSVTIPDLQPGTYTCVVRDRPVT